MDEYTREPCPWRILDDCGGAFAMGAVGGSIFQGIKGYINAPVGFRKRMSSTFASIATKGPLLGGQFAVWGGMFSVIDCSLVSIRKKEDPWNSIMSGAATGGLLAIRNGKAAIITSAVVGGVLLGLIEGMSLMITKMSAEQFKPSNGPFEAPPSDGKQNGFS